MDRGKLFTVRILAFLILILLYPIAARSQSFMLDNFEEASLREANPGANDYTRYLWSVMDYGAGTTGLTTGDKSAGNKSLLNHYVNGDPEWQFQFYPNTISGGVNHYQYARYFVLNGPWVLNKI